MNLGRRLLSSCDSGAAQPQDDGQPNDPGRGVPKSPQPATGQPTSAPVTDPASDPATGSPDHSETRETRMPDEDAEIVEDMTQR